jgi:serine/threonine protein kinase
MVHRDLHTGNILFFANSINFDGNILSISDMGLCGKIDNIDETNVYGVMPYVASEVLRGKSYTQAADIYSFGMIMYFVATGKQPLADRAHDEFLALDICKGIRPEINELGVPKIYVDLMKKCWDLNPGNRPNSIEIYDQFEKINRMRATLNVTAISAISNENKTIEINENEITKANENKITKADGNESIMNISEIIRKAEEYRIANLSSIKNNQLPAYNQYSCTSKLLNPFTNDLSAECLDCKI